jgi:hypothetical protein
MCVCVCVCVCVSTRNLEINLYIFTYKVLYQSEGNMHGNISGKINSFRNILYKTISKVKIISIYLDNSFKRILLRNVFVLWTA